MLPSNRAVNFVIALSKRMASNKYVGTSERGLTEEFSFSVPWGKVCGKTWGDEEKPPVLCLHGWLDNCNSFDKLVPLLPQDYYYVAIDTPGHGLSSHYSQGAFYFTVSYCGVLKRVVDHFKFKSITMLGHSMGANVGAYFGCIYPEIVKRIIIIDSTGAWFRAKADLVTGIRSCIDTHLAFENTVRQEKEYTYEQAKERLEKANQDLNEEAVKILLQRGAEENENGNFTFRRDIRHLFKDPIERDLNVSLSLLENISADILFIWAKNGLYKKLKIAYEKEAKQIREIYEKHAKSVTVVELEGNHHLHLCTPKETAKHIAKFLQDCPIETDEKVKDSSQL